MEDILPKSEELQELLEIAKKYGRGSEEAQAYRQKIGIAWRINPTPTQAQTCNLEQTRKFLTAMVRELPGRSVPQYIVLLSKAPADKLTQNRVSYHMKRLVKKEEIQRIGYKYYPYPVEE